MWVGYCVFTIYTHGKHNRSKDRATQQRCGQSGRQSQATSQEPPELALFFAFRSKK